MKIIGISSFYHDSAAALVVDGDIVCAFQEERFSRIKHDSEFPKQSILECLKFSKIAPQDIDAIVFYEKPLLKFERLMETSLAFAPMGFSSFLKAIPLWISEKIFQKKILADHLSEIGFTKRQCREILFSEHHLSHAASAFYPSTFNEAIILTMDGVGEWETCSVYIGKENTLEKKRELRFPHSLGMLYSAFTYYCGFKVNSGEYKLMGLAPYGNPQYVDVIKNNLIDIKADGSFKLDMSYFNYCTGLTMTSKKFDQLFHNKKRNSDQTIEQFHMDLAASIQQVTEEIILLICQDLRNEYGIKNLCLAGGVALNCVANGKILQKNIFDHIWIQPAAGDAGGSLGAALSCYYDHFKNKRLVTSQDKMNGAFLGNEYSDSEIEHQLRALGAHYTKMSENEVINTICQSLIRGDAIGLFQGRMEFGPRSLGNRSIIADARSDSMQETLNIKIKFRESFRPFAPAVLEEDAQSYFQLKASSPYMLYTAQISEHIKIPTKLDLTKSGFIRLKEKRSMLPAITHVDNSARIQTVSKETSPKFHKLISKFNELTGCPIIVNTSFNVRGEPIVCSPLDAYKCFMGTQIDLLVLENFVLFKKDQQSDLLENYHLNFKED